MNIPDGRLFYLPFLPEDPHILKTQKFSETPAGNNGLFNRPPNTVKFFFSGIMKNENPLPDYPRFPEPNIQLNIFIAMGTIHK